MMELFAQLQAATTECEVDDAFESVFDLIHEVRMSGEVSRLEQLLKWASSNSSGLNDEILLSILRLSFTIREEVLLQWTTLLDDTARQLEERKLDARLLWGLRRPA